MAADKIPNIYKTAVKIIAKGALNPCVKAKVEYNTTSKSDLESMIDKMPNLNINERLELIGNDLPGIDSGE